VVLLWRRILLAAGLIFAVFQGNAFAADQEPFLAFDAEYYYRAAYPGLKGHKAFAIGPQSAYGYAWQARSSKEAANLALKFCSNSVAKLKKYGITGKCRLFALDSKLLIRDPWIGVSWQVPSTGEDIPLNKGFKTMVMGHPARGVVLYVHGCDGLSWKERTEIWGSYFNALRFIFFAPDSFAEPRPSAVCGEVSRTRTRDQTVIYKLRIAQTLRNIAELKKKYPGLPIYVWGHSEGGIIVKYLNVEVAGIISSGEECDAGGLKIAVPASVPMLYLFGESDPFVEGRKLPLRDNEMQKCRNYVRSKKVKIEIIKNSRHDIWPWRPVVARAISEFIGAEPFSLAKAQSKGKFALSEKLISQRAIYARAGNHRAFAAKANGSFSWGGDWAFAEDVEQYVLYRCARANNMNVFRLSEHTCTVIDVDGKDMTAP